MISYPSLTTESLKIYLILIVNDVFLFYIKHVKQLQLSHLTFVCEKEAVFVPKSEKIVAKINGITSSYKVGTPTAKSDMSQKENQNCRKVLSESIVSNIIG